MMELLMVKPLVVFIPGLLCDQRVFGSMISLISELGYDHYIVKHYLDSSINDITNRIKCDISQDREIIIIGLSMGGYVALDAYFQKSWIVRWTRAS